MELQVDVADRIIDLADDYARAIVNTAQCPVTPAHELQEGVAGALIQFLADALALVETPV